MLKCCNLPALEEWLQEEWQETDVDCRTDELKEAVDRVIELSAIPRYEFESTKMFSAREIMFGLGRLESALTKSGKFPEDDMFLAQLRNVNIRTWLDGMLKLFMGYLFMHFGSYLPEEILKAFRKALIQGPIEPVRSSERRSDEYTRLEVGLDQLISQLGAGHSHYLEVLSYQQRLIEIIEKSRRYGDTPTHTAERNEIVDYLNEIALSELSKPFNELCSTLVHGIGLPDSMGQIFQTLDFFFRNGELPAERDKRLMINRGVLNSIQDPDERAKRHTELEVEEKRIREHNQEWVKKLQNECWRDFGRLSPLDSVNLAVFSELTDLYQGPIIHKEIEFLLEDLANEQLEEIRTLLREIKVIIKHLKTTVPRIMVIMGSGVDNHGNHVVWFVDRLGNRQPQNSECLEWAYFSSEIELEPFQQVAMIPSPDDNRLKPLIDPVIYPVKQIEAFIERILVAS